MKREIGIGLMGMGVVGSGVASVLLEREEDLSRPLGCPLRLRRILLRHPEKPHPFSPPPGLLTTHAADILDDPTIDIIIEVMGGENPALDYQRQSLLRGKHVVTANKEVIAKHGPTLLALAAEKGLEVRYEASVGGGIPLVRPFQEDLAANRISAVTAIINGTTNYILTRMASEAVEFAQALKGAQELGYAEADPTNDIMGIDSAYKLAILATLAFHTPVHPDEVYREGITRLAGRDFRYARELGYAIKLFAIAKEREGAVEVRVHPVLTPQDAPLAKTEGAYNAVQVDGDLTGRVIFYGLGAGSRPTTSAVIADVLEIAHRLCHGVPVVSRLQLDTTKTIVPISRLSNRFYLRMNVADRPGVLAQIARILGERQISIASVIQKETDERAGTAEIVIMTHPALEAAMQQAIMEMENLGVVKEISNFIRVEG